jgi:RNA polymerase sigma-70 factor (ECF subfamily)
MQAGTAVGNLASTIAVQSGEATLVSELKAGSEEAYALLVALYHQPIYSVIARSLHDPADAADVTQEVFLKAFRGIGGFHEESTLKTWLYRIALHESANRRRWWSRHKQQELTIDTPTGGNQDTEHCLRDSLADEGRSPFDEAAAEEARTRVEAGLRKLPENFRTVVILREIEGFAYDEIAEILQINIGTVKSRLMRGRAALKTHLFAAQKEAAR